MGATETQTRPRLRSPLADSRSSFREARGDQRQGQRCDRWWLLCRGRGMRSGCRVAFGIHRHHGSHLRAPAGPLHGTVFVPAVRFLLVHRDSWSGRCFSRLTGQTEGRQCSSPSRWLLIPQKRTVGLVVKAADWLLAVCATLGEV